MSYTLQAAARVLEEELTISEPVKEVFYVDFLRDAPEPTGDEAEDADLDAPKIYEQVKFIPTALYTLFYTVIVL